MENWQLLITDLSQSLRNEFTQWKCQSWLFSPTINQKLLSFRRLLQNIKQDGYYVRLGRVQPASQIPSLKRSRVVIRDSGLPQMWVICSGLKSCSLNLAFEWTRTYQDFQKLILTSLSVFPHVLGLQAGRTQLSQARMLQVVWQQHS